jgi:LysR family transcriptional regulator, glycine cleavage system transcriptional activator
VEKNGVTLGNLSLGGLHAFEAASRLGSFKAAAEELSVTPAAISHRIKGLEAQLGLQLFERLNRSLRLTSSGQSLARVVSHAFSAIDAALAEIATRGEGRSSAIITVSAAPSLATKWLAPRLHRFSERNPRFEVRLDASNELADLVRDRRVDAALRYGPGPYGEELRAERLWANGSVIPVCAPSLLAAALILAPSDLLRQRLLRTAAPSGGGKLPAIDWGAWFEAAGVGREVGAGAAAHGPIFSSTQLALEAAASGRGFALAPTVLVGNDLLTGRLVQPFQTALPDPYSYWLLYRADRAMESGVAAFARWVMEEAASSPDRRSDRAAAMPS